MKTTKRKSSATTKRVGAFKPKAEKVKRPSGWFFEKRRREKIAAELAAKQEFMQREEPEELETLDACIRRGTKYINDADMGRMERADATKGMWKLRQQHDMVKLRADLAEIIEMNRLLREGRHEQTSNTYQDFLPARETAYTEGN